MDWKGNFQLPEFVHVHAIVHYVGVDNLGRNFFIVLAAISDLNKVLSSPDHRYWNDVLNKLDHMQMFTISNVRRMGR